MASLRRPSAAISKPGSGPRPTSQYPAHPEDNDGRRRDARKSKVGDKIRKRMSMRYLVGENLTPAPPLPGGNDFLSSDPYGGLAGEGGESAIPSGVATPIGISEDGTRGGEAFFTQFGSPEFAQSGFGTSPSKNRNLPSRGEVQASALRAEEGIRRRGAADMTRDDEWDFEEIASENFDLQGFMRRTLTGADQEEKKRFMAAVMRAKQGNAKDLKRNVFKHYAEFVTISKEISTLENDMLELKELLGQWKDLPQLMGMEDTLAPTLDKNGNLERRRTQRNSVMDLQNMYKTQLTQLWSTVEGSQKYLPLIPGRHLVFETHNFVELNAATYKAKQSVSMFLLNDLLLIAGRRRMKGDGSGNGNGAGNDASAGAGETGKERERGRMVAERCWVLADLVVVDVKDSGDLTNALKIRRGKEVCVYRTAKPEEKKALLAAFRQVSQELGEKKRKESEKEQERRKSMWHGDQGGSGPGGYKGGPSVPNFEDSARGRPLSTIGVSMADSKDLRWIDEFGDELTMAIAMRDWDEAVKSIEKGRDLLKTVSSNISAHSLLSTKISLLEPTLISQITFDLSSANLRKVKAIKLISLLTKLDQSNLARDTFLNSRKSVMLSRIRGIKCEGDISIYISELTIVSFTILRHTSDWYMSAFKENRMASGFVTWAKEQIEAFADLFRRQVYAPDIDAAVVDECIHVTASHNRKLLRDVGLDFTYLLSSLLQPDPKSSSTNILFESASTSASQTPGPYHIEASPFVPYSYPQNVPDTPATFSGPGSMSMSMSRDRSGSSLDMKRQGSSTSSSVPGHGPVPMNRQVSNQSSVSASGTGIGRQGSAGGGGGMSMGREGSSASGISGISMGRDNSQSSRNGNTQPLVVPSRTRPRRQSSSNSNSNSNSASGSGSGGAGRGRSPSFSSKEVEREELKTPTVNQEQQSREREINTPTQTTNKLSNQLQSHTLGYSLGPAIGANSSTAATPTPTATAARESQNANGAGTSPVLPPRSERRARPPPRSSGGAL